METTKEELRSNFEKFINDNDASNEMLCDVQDDLFSWFYQEIEAREHTFQKLEEENRLKWDTILTLNAKISRLESTLVAAKIACEIVVNGYKVDGFENMQPRDHVFYKHCEQALSNLK